jgi:hypothetical protein
MKVPRIRQWTTGMTGLNRALLMRLLGRVHLQERRAFFSWETSEPTAVRSALEERPARYRSVSTGNPDGFACSRYDFEYFDGIGLNAIGFCE